MNGFQSGAFQVSGFQISAATAQPTGGYGFGAYDPYRRKRELIEQLERLEELIAEDRDVPVEVVRVEVERQLVVTPLPPRVKRVVQRAIEIQTLGALEHAETVLRRLQEQEEEEFAVLMSLALH